MQKVLIIGSLLRFAVYKVCMKWLIGAWKIRKKELRKCVFFFSISWFVIIFHYRMSTMKSQSFAAPVTLVKLARILPEQRLFYSWEVLATPKKSFPKCLITTAERMAHFNYFSKETKGFSTYVKYPHQFSRRARWVKKNHSHTVQQKSFFSRIQNDFRKSVNPKMDANSLWLVTQT